MKTLFYFFCCCFLLVIISMGASGARTRIECRKTGCAMTFSSIGNGSAPGQIGLEEMMTKL